MTFFNSAVDVLQTLVIALGAGLGIWGVINLLEGYPVILAATKGDPDAMKLVLQHYQSYIAHLSMQKIRDESGNTYWGIDEDLRERLQAKLMRAVLNFKAD